MLGNAHFYNRTIRKIVIAMGTVLNDIQLVRYTKDGLTAKEKYIVRINSDPTLNKSVNVIVPRISFELTGMNYDSSRKQQSTLMNCSTDANTTSKTQYLPVPYDFTFDAAIYVRNTEDGTQILEQILPFFTPDFTVTAKLVPDLNRSYDLPIILNSVSNEVDYEGDFMTTRLIIWNLSFTVKGYIFPGVKDSKIIRSATITAKDSETSNVYVTINTQPDPANAGPDDEFGFAEIITEAPNVP